jgi:hypothetical protein
VIYYGHILKLILVSAELEKDFPYWQRLHGFWRTLPNFNPHTVSSEPGQDLVGEAMDHMLRHNGEVDSSQDSSDVGADANGDLGNASANGDDGNTSANGGDGNANADGGDGNASADGGDEAGDNGNENRAEDMNGASDLNDESLYAVRISIGLSFLIYAKVFSLLRQDRDFDQEMSSDSEIASTPQSNPRSRPYSLSSAFNTPANSDSRSLGSRSTSVFGSSSKPNTPTPSSTKTSSKAKAIASNQPRSAIKSLKRSRVEAFRDETAIGNQQVVELASKKLDAKMAELAVKRQKLEVVGNREIEKERLVAEERQLVAKERIMEKEHQRQREKEEHAERMLRMQIELARAAGPSRTGPNFASNAPAPPSLTFSDDHSGLSYGNGYGLAGGLNGDGTSMHSVAGW